MLYFSLPKDGKEALWPPAGILLPVQAGHGILNALSLLSPHRQAGQGRMLQGMPKSGLQQGKPAMRNRTVWRCGNIEHRCHRI